MYSEPIDATDVLDLSTHFDVLPMSAEEQAEFLTANADWIADPRMRNPAECELAEYELREDAM